MVYIFWRIPIKVSSGTRKIIESISVDYSVSIDIHNFIPFTQVQTLVFWYVWQCGMFYIGISGITDFFNDIPVKSYIAELGSSNFDTNVHTTIKNPRSPVINCKISYVVIGIRVGTCTFPRIRVLGWLIKLYQPIGFKAGITKSNYTAVHLTSRLLRAKLHSSLSLWATQPV